MLKRVNQNYYFGLDFLRGIAIVLMLITHGFRLFVKSTPNYQAGTDLAERLLNLFAIIEPYTSALFLFLAGIGVTISFSQKKDSANNWLKRQSIKAGQLYLIGMGLFFIEKGFQSPDFWISPSILSTIAISMITVASGLLIPWGIVLGLILTAGITYYFEGTGISGINAGPGGVFPLITFALWGSLIWQIFKQKKYYFLGLIGLLSLGSYFNDSPWVQHYNSTYHQWTSGSTGLDFIMSLGEYHITELESYWNHSLIASIRIVGLLLISLWLCLKFSKNLEAKKFNHLLTLLGRHSLGCYILHLMIIAIFDLAKIYPTTPIMDWLFIAFLIAICSGYAKFKERK